MKSIQVHKVELMVIDFDGVGETNIREIIENANYPNDCIHPHVKRVESRSVTWTDDHPLNKHDTADETYRKLFATP